MDNEDLKEIEKEIDERQAQAVATVEQNSVAPVITFEKPVEKPVEKQEEVKHKDTAGELVDI